MGAALGLIGPLASIGGSIFGMMNGPPAANVPQAPPVYQPTGQGYADASLQSGTGQLSSSTVPSAINTQNFLYNNPGAPGAQAGADVAGRLGMAAGLQDFTQGGNLVNTGNSVVPYAYSALNEGFDPLGNVYKQNFQQNTDQTRALLEARGIDSTPYGAGVEAQSDLNFNNNWQANLLSRMQAGAGAANTLLGTQANDINAGTNLANMAPGTYFGGASLPYNTNQTIGTNQFGALSGSQGLQQQPLQDYLQYLQLGQGAAGVGTQQQQTNLNQANAQFTQNNQLGQNLGAGIQGLTKGWQAFAGNNNGNFNTFNAPGYSFPQAA